MPNVSFTVTIIDTWPKLKLLVMPSTPSRPTRSEGPIMYDIANSQFTPAVQDALRLAVEEVIKSRKGG